MMVLATVVVVTGSDESDPIVCSVDGWLDIILLLFPCSYLLVVACAECLSCRLINIIQTLFITKKKPGSTTKKRRARRRRSPLFSNLFSSSSFLTVRIARFRMVRDKLSRNCTFQISYNNIRMIWIQLRRRTAPLTPVISRPCLGGSGNSPRNSQESCLHITHRLESGWRHGRCCRCFL